MLLIYCCCCCWKKKTSELGLLFSMYLFKFFDSKRRNTSINATTHQYVLTTGIAYTYTCKITQAHLTPSKYKCVKPNKPIEINLIKGERNNVE